MGKIDQADEKTIVVAPADADLAEYFPLAPPDALNTGYEVTGESSDLDGQVCTICDHKIDPARRGSPRCVNQCGCTSGGCTINVIPVDAPTPEPGVSTDHTTVSGTAPV